MPTKYAWRLLNRDGEPTSVVLTLADDEDAPVVSLVRAAAERHGVRLEPVHPDELEPAGAPTS